MTMSDGTLNNMKDVLKSSISKSMSQEWVEEMKDEDGKA